MNRERERKRRNLNNNKTTKPRFCSESFIPLAKYSYIEVFHSSEIFAGLIFGNIFIGHGKETKQEEKKKKKTLCPLKKPKEREREKNK